ncbi:hypothetical protein [Paludisphaera borealis]|uniref:Cysteinyl-tRNA synthetase n=1 Tax=Paludisphaera borealis TaxID=1387353 RepID=A0A1U7CNN8_9BACT|nr:hypothetical protein [Paludisphaera borealis]APW60528.1 hypothetical protein BSF38_01999 [Paludisphaera borealis]
MATLTEGKLRFTFAEDWTVSQYDDWGHYRNQFIKVCGSIKAVDVVAIEPNGCCWLLEIKDYREHVRTKTIHLADEMAEKVRDTLAGLVAAQFRADDESEKIAAKQALRATSLRVVLHLEQPTKPSKLFPRAINPATVLQRLRQLIKAIDPHPQVVETATSRNLPWTIH